MTGIRRSVVVLLALCVAAVSSPARADCSSPFGTAGQAVYNQTTKQAQYCDGTEWIAMHPPGAGTGGCSDPIANVGSIAYNSTTRQMQACAGSEWRAMGPPPSVPTHGLIGHWTLDETNGTVAADSSGSGYHGTLTSFSGQPSWTNGKSGGALSFDDNSNRIVTGLDIDQQSGNTSYTFSAWAYPEALCLHNWCHLLSTDDGGYQWAIQTQDDIWWVYTGDSAEAQAAVLYDEWQHVAVVYDTSVDEYTFYLNGQSVGSGSIFTSGGDDNFTIGNIPYGGGAFVGKIDDARVYDRALVSEELAQLYAAGGGACSNPEGPEGALLYNDAGADQFLGPPTGCPNVGNVCSDGTIYAGISPDGNERMYVTTVDEEEWLKFDQTSGSNGILTGMELCSSTEDTCFTGHANTEFLVELSNDGFGHDPYDAAVYCDELEAYDRDDWYLPSVGELHVLFTNEDAIGDFNDTYPNSRYGSSSESSIHHRWIISFDQGPSYGDVYGGNKGAAQSVRCVRRDGITDDGAPPEGGVMQYCNGAEWVAIGKVPAQFSCVGAGGVEEGGACWFLGNTSESCNDVCAANDLDYDDATGTYGGANTGQCRAVLDALSAPGSGNPSSSTCSYGCSYRTSFGGQRRLCNSVSASASSGSYRRACACQP